MRAIEWRRSCLLLGLRLKEVVCVVISERAGGSRRTALVKTDSVSQYENFMMVAMMVVVISSIAYRLK